MSARSHFAALFAHFQIYAAILALIFCIAIVALPAKTDAAGAESDAQCVPAIPPCPCGMIMGPQGCIPGPNKFMCPCVDVTNGFSTPGTCSASGICKASGGGGGGGGQPPQMPKPPGGGGGGGQPPPPQNQQPCGAGGSSGGSTSKDKTSSTTSATSTKSNSASDPCSAFGATDFSQFGSFPSFDTSIFNGVGTSNGSDAVNNLISSLLNGNINANSNAVADESGTSGANGGSANANTPAQSQPRVPFGSVEGVSGDIQLQGNVLTILVSNRDSVRGTQVSGTYGLTIASGVPALTVFKNICAMRPWTSNFLSFILPSAYFDALCTARGLSIAPQSVAPAATAAAKPATTGSGIKSVPVATGTAKPETPPPYLGPMRADIWAVPASVAAGSRTNIFWESTGVTSCTIKSSDNAFSGTALSGHAQSQLISKNTTFSITCMSATSTVSNQVVVTVQ